MPCRGFTAEPCHTQRHGNGGRGSSHNCSWQGLQRLHGFKNARQRWSANDLRHVSRCCRATCVSYDAVQRHTPSATALTETRTALTTALTQTHSNGCTAVCCCMTKQRRSYHLAHTCTHRLQGVVWQLHVPVATTTAHALLLS
jgi:hypothetical protein